jgi:hypothetical protein
MASRPKARALVLQDAAREVLELGSELIALREALAHGLTSSVEVVLELAGVFVAGSTRRSPSVPANSGMADTPGDDADAVADGDLGDATVGEQQICPWSLSSTFCPRNCADRVSRKGSSWNRLRGPR